MKLAVIAALLFANSILNLEAADVSEGVFINSNQNFLEEASKNSLWTIDHRSSKGFEVYGPTGLKNQLRAQSISFTDLDKENFFKEKFSDYPSFEDLTQTLMDIHAAYPDLTELTSAGKTNEGRELWVMQISKHILDSALLPEVKYISSMHGNEITGRELMVLLMQDLLANYGKDEKITSLINNSRIFIIPSMNPDGSSKSRRGNANNMDLNRNFPDFSTSDNENSLIGREVETQAIMNFQSERHFALSANFHGGAEVVNYMWDGFKDQHPLHSLLKDISLTYAEKVSYMKNSKEFENGITNGFEWYQVNGGMQDWSYFWYGDTQFTIELSEKKWPSYSMIPHYYMENRESLIQFLQTVHQGAGVIYLQSEVNGVVNILKDMGPDLDKKNLGAYPLKNSYFYKVLEPGKYIFVIDRGNDEFDRAEVEIKAGTIYSGGNFVYF
ncbi:MAG: DUF2817 domain-containing protein [Deltaproteobacteria bacterium]|nr:DUF2817 domain-containing protein [Deltaproteobacteria bacterium]